MNRREFHKAALAAPLFATMPSMATIRAQSSPQTTDYDGGLSDIPGIRLGHCTASACPTGCTVVLVEKGAIAGVDVRGGAPGTRETDLLDPVNTVESVQAIALSGGSAFGLDTATGVMRYLKEKGLGFQLGRHRVPIVPTAILFDLSASDHQVPPGAAEGYQACQNASDGPVAEGNVGAGAGATVGKLLGMARGMKGGLGSCSIRVDDLIVAAVIAVNAVGDVRDPHTGAIVAGARGAEPGQMADAAKALMAAKRPGPRAGNTTIGVVATNARLTPAQATKVAVMAHDGMARTILPSHTPYDGDTIFALSAGEVSADVGQVGFLASEAVSRAILRAIRQAKSIDGFPAAADWLKSDSAG